MDDSLNVLVLQTDARTADPAVEALEASGHRVHRCHDEDARGFPCRGARDRSACPLDGHIDVALVSRRGVRPHPTELETGVTCAIRAGLPIVEEGTDLLDPFAPWVTKRVSTAAQTPQACVDAVEAGHVPLLLAIEARISKLLRASGIELAAVACTIHPRPAGLVITLALPTPVATGVEHALAVRVLDAVRSTGRTYGHIEVSVSASDSD